MTAGASDPPLVASADALRARVGAAPLASGWIDVGQARVDRFAAATDDHQWIHVDPERAARESPFGGPIAHGFLTLSLIPALMTDTLRFEQRMGVNYGLNRVRFLKPVPVGSRVRALFALKETGPAKQGGVQAVWAVSVEVELGGEPVPACAAEFITLHYF
ncbi:MaoC family dehydratase [Burkholderia sp. ABCPW 111]|uniref:MaoC family dehydratase n=1 Tax=Burkholderia sp. ABCPW 111 TaxID=1820025 RepID=UPI0005318B6B|nr:MaoC family dehydratase [Burkholderia sp. ABCPW 111]KGS03012.1 maoC like domain protein [Burkholderia sp. ABCPW 111]